MRMNDSICIVFEGSINYGDEGDLVVTSSIAIGVFVANVVQSMRSAIVRDIAGERR